MANGQALAAKRAARVMLIGFPGAGKTGACVSLLNAGYKLRVLDYDGNFDPLIQYAKPDKLANLDIVSLKDPLRAGNKYIEVAGLPEAFNRGLKLMKEWKYTDEATGQEVNLGASKDWGPDTVLVLDSLTSMGVAAFRRTMAMMNKTPLNGTQQMWGVAMADQDAFVEALTDPKNRFHVVVLSHKKMIAPKETTPSDAGTANEEIKKEKAELIPVRFYPSALGQGLPTTIGGRFPTILEIEAETKPSGAIVHHIKASPRPDLDLKIPVPELPKSLTVEDDGLLKVFDLLTAGTKANLAVGS